MQMIQFDYLTLKFNSTISLWNITRTRTLGGVITVSGAKFMGQILYVNDQMQKTYDESDKNTKHENRNNNRKH